MLLGCPRKSPCATCTVLDPQVKYHPTPVLEPETPWERKGGAYTRPYSGGVWWEPRESRFKMFYGASRLRALCLCHHLDDAVLLSAGCGLSNPHDASAALCLATSRDGFAWERPKLDVVAGTNIVINQYLNSNNVWLDHNATNEDERYVLADTGTRGGKSSWAQYRLWSSPDGVHWRVRQNTTGPTSDAGTIFHNPLRSPPRWIFSIKGMDAEDGKHFGRYRQYFESPALFGSTWTKDDPVPWTNANSLDPGWLAPAGSHGAIGQFAELYRLDAAPYESL